MSFCYRWYTVKDLPFILQKDTYYSRGKPWSIIILIFRASSVRTPCINTIYYLFNFQSFKTNSPLTFPAHPITGGPNTRAVYIRLYYSIIFHFLIYVYTGNQMGVIKLWYLYWCKLHRFGIYTVIRSERSISFNFNYNCVGLRCDRPLLFRPGSFASVYVADTKTNAPERAEYISSGRLL